jgi:GNAT superfamily N-acetyltransferase
MRYEVEQSPRGGWSVRAAGFGKPLSTHDTEDEARDAADTLAAHDSDPGQVAEVLDAAAEHVRLKDGSEVRIRPVVPSDRKLFVEGFQHFGAESRQSRFLGMKKELTEKDLDFLTNVDHEEHEAIGAIDVDTGAGVGVARMMRDPKCPGVCAEAAVAVVDDWQGRGLGGVLLGRMVARARELGVDRWMAVLRTDNRAMLTLFQRTGNVSVREREGNVTTIEVELPVDGPAGALETALRHAAAGNVEALRA